MITPPFGYWKDRNTNTVQFHPEAAETVRMIYSLYLQGFGQKKIARRLNDLDRKTPAQLRAEQCGREVRAAHKTRDGHYLWTYGSVKNVLTEEAYTGVLINHRTETNSGKAKRLEQAEWYRHKNILPVIIQRDIWEKVQQKLKAQARPANRNRSKHRYAGLLRCRECGNVFVPMIRYWNGKRRVEYVCKGYHRSGKSYCSSPYPRGNAGYYGVGASHGGSGQSRQRAGEPCETAKNVGVEETSPRRPHFIVAGKDSRAGAGDRWDYHRKNRSY
ncbi:MAG: recombinase family protein [Dysosmobacter sp.]